MWITRVAVGPRSRGKKIPLFGSRPQFSSPTFAPATAAPGLAVGSTHLVQYFSISIQQTRQFGLHLGQFLNPAGGLHLRRLFPNRFRQRFLVAGIVQSGRQIQRRQYAITPNINLKRIVVLRVRRLITYHDRFTTDNVSLTHSSAAYVRAGGQSPY